ncbi:MAG TPA: DUF3179 domain-containing protein [Thermoanaerobaculia bacterium]|nr:DUF3179 domain-containing protein [Thermoanaerobaculia bacterium]
MRGTEIASAIALVLALRFATSPTEISPERAGELLARLLSGGEGSRAAARVAISRSRDVSLVPALVDALFFASGPARDDVVACLESLSGERLGTQYRYWVEYVGGHQDIRPKEGYRAWKAALFARIDPAFAKFLHPSLPISIRPEEIVWGGVRKDGIPALVNPDRVSAAEATFLEGAETVFGIELGKESRAYPQRILDWHEMANDVVGGRAFALSYCTLCGSAIAYATGTTGGPALVFGSSGLLYRSNKLMYDQGTLSLWSNLTGEPVVGPLVGRDVRLMPLPVTVSTWADWKARHPDTTVVSLKTGHRRDYAPGAAYGRYFASPETMFPVWRKSPAMPAKSWIYGLRSGLRAKAYPEDALFRERVVNDVLGSLPVVIVADPESGAVRAYERGNRSFAEGPEGSVVDPQTGETWAIAEDGLRRRSGEVSLQRVAGHRAYWFGWYAFFPETEVYEGCRPEGS